MMVLDKLSPALSSFPNQRNMAASLEEDDDILKNDYYALLNVGKDATIEEINNAFRHLSKIYHPDKHVDPIKKRKAEEVFNNLRKAHDVLRDKYKRTVYDMYGEKGLETGDMEIIARTKTPQEIIAEYERIQKEKEERRLQQRTNPRGTISVGINASELFDVDYDDEDLDYQPSRSVEISSMTIAQTVECPLTLKDTVVLGGNLDTRNGIGQGMFTVMWRRLVSDKGWAEGTISVGINASELFDVDYDDEDLDYQPSRSVEISSMTIAQTVECPLTLKDTVVLGGNLDTRNGIGQGMFTVMWRRLVSDKGWAELDFHFGSAVSLGITGFRQLTQRCYVRCGARADLTQFGYRPSATFMLAYQFDRNIQGRLTYNLARPSSIVTNIAYSSEVSNISSSCQLGVKLSYLSLSYTRTFVEQDTKVRGAIRIGTMGSMVECGIEKKVTDFSHIGGTLSVGIPQGVHLKLKMMRGQQTFFFPIYLSSDGLNPSAILYGAVVPVVAFFVMKKLIINPILKQQKLKELEKQKEEYAEKMAQKKSEAEKA
ncbi:Dnaj-like protein subfamily c member 11, partial [Plakobranchus ocellatus]